MENKKAMKILGIVFIVTGIILGLIGLFSFIFASKNTFGNFGSFDQQVSGMQNTLFGASVGIALIFFGTLLFMAGIVLVYLASIKKVSGYVAKETAPAVETTYTAVGRGLKKGLKDR